MLPAPTVDKLLRAPWLRRRKGFHHESAADSRVAPSTGDSSLRDRS